MFRLVLAFWLALVSGLGGVGASLAAGDQEKLKAGLLAAAEGLILIDRGQFAQSWDRAAACLKEKLPQGQWVQQLRTQRLPLGTLSYRKLIFSRFTDRLPEWPAGEYLVLRYQSSFARRPLAFENLTLQREGDGAWRLADYQVK